MDHADTPSATDAAYIQHPTLRGDRLVFAAQGNLWETSPEGGAARRLSSSDAVHSFPRLSPDGRWIAFSSADEGPPAVWIMPAEGGPARRLTYQSVPCHAVGWSADGSRVMYRAVGVAGMRTWVLCSVPLEGGASRIEPYGRADNVAFHPDGERVALQRHANDPAWWKRYAGGRAGRIWLGSASTGDFEKLPGGPRTDACPMWIGDELWFLSDQDGGGDLWRADADGTNRRRVTSHPEYFARWPAADGTRIVYTMGARLYLLDTADAQPTPREIEVQVRGHSLSDRRRLVDPVEHLSDYAISADGKESLFTLRGRVVRLPNWHGAASELAHLPGIRFRGACWIGSEGAVAAIANIDEEDQVVILPAGGAGDDPSRCRVLGGVGRRIRHVVPSPDGKRIAICDQGRGLHVMDAETGNVALVDDEGQMWVRECAWSPCSTWLAYVRQYEWWSGRLFVWGAKNHERHQIGSQEFAESSPAWDPAGRYLAFLSIRHLDPYYSQIEHDFGFPASTRAYVTMLRADEPVPFAAETEAPKEAPERASDEPLEIEFEGIADRAFPLPFEAGTHLRVGCSTTGVALLTMPTAGALTTQSPAFEGPDAANYSVKTFDFADRKVEDALSGVTGWAESADGKRWLYRMGRKFRVLPAAAKPEEGPKPESHCSPKTGWLDLGRIAVSVDPRSEYRQIVQEAWRMQRDHFYDERLVNVDWQACLDRYLPLVDRIRTRDELNDLLWELQGELGTSHAYAFGGDLSSARRYAPGLLGCDYEQDEETGAYRFARIYRGDVWKEGDHSPLVAPGKNVREGQYLLAVDGRRVGRDTHPGECLLGRAGKQVTLTVADQADGTGSRDVIVTPQGDETYSRYRTWVDDNRVKVEQATDNKIGYVHIPDMGVPGAIEFTRGFVWQVRHRDGFVIDARYNGGGNISYILLAKLLRKIVGWTCSRWGEPRTYPYHTPKGPIVVLTNENAGSDGDIFSQAVKATGLGPLIGMRTWGGVVGIDMSKDLVDGGKTSQPEYAFWFDGVGWSVENHGVEPDIVVDRTPSNAIRGEDPQLDRAITEVMALLAKRPQTPPDFGPKPDLRWPK